MPSVSNIANSVSQTVTFQKFILTRLPILHLFTHDSRILSTINLHPQKLSNYNSLSQEEYMHANMNKYAYRACQYDIR